MSDEQRHLDPKDIYENSYEQSRAVSSVRPSREKDARTDTTSTQSASQRLLSICRLLVVISIIGSAFFFTYALILRPLNHLALLGLGLSIVALSICAAFQMRNRNEIEKLNVNYLRANQIAELYASIIASFAMAIDAKDQHTHGHTLRVRDIAVMIAEEMNLPQDEIEALKTAAMLHDIGKLAVPDYILSKPAQLSDDEMRKVMTHTMIGAAILESVKFPWPVVPIIRSHHEWYDGSGYPDKIKYDHIPLGARILAVADVYDALLSHRPFRPAMTVQEAVKFMEDRSGTQFDPEILQLCFKVLSSSHAQNRFGFIYNADGPNSSSIDSPGQRAVYQGIAQAHQELFSLYEIVQTMGQSLNMEETAELIISKTKRIIDFATCVLYLTREEDNSLVAIAASGPYSELIRGRRLPCGVGISGAVAVSGIASGAESSAIVDLEILLGPAIRECSLTEVIAAPLSNGGETIGVITLYRPPSRPFTDDEARLASTIARQATIAINNARQYEATKQSALTDQLTGLRNARFFYMQLEQEIIRSQQLGIPTSLIAIDLNNLKNINDNFGHQQGDRVLRLVADVFRRHVRETDVVVRYAGDEFFIILPNTNNKEAVETANRMKAAIRQTKLDLRPDHTVTLGASFGVATFPGDAEDMQNLIAIADRAMYADKRLSHQVKLFADQREANESTVTSSSDNLQED